MFGFIICERVTQKSMKVRCQIQRNQCSDSSVKYDMRFYLIFCGNVSFIWKFHYDFCPLSARKKERKSDKLHE